MPDDIRKSIAAELGLAGMAPEEQDKVIAGFGEVALKAATIAVLEKVPEDKRDEFARLTETGDAAALQAFLDKEVPEHEHTAREAIAAEVTRLKEVSAL